MPSCLDDDLDCSMPSSNIQLKKYTIKIDDKFDFIKNINNLHIVFLHNATKGAQQPMDHEQIFLNE